jgi:hypothetical protein
MTKTAIICGLYTRVSSRNQAEADYSSLEAPRERLEAYCKSQEDYTVWRSQSMLWKNSGRMTQLRESTRSFRGVRVACGRLVITRQPLPKRLCSPW